MSDVKTFEKLFEYQYIIARLLADAREKINRYELFLPDSAGADAWRTWYDRREPCEPWDLNAYRFSTKGALIRAVYGTRSPEEHPVAKSAVRYQTCLDYFALGKERFYYLERLCPEALWLVPQDHLTHGFVDHARALKTFDIALEFVKRDYALTSQYITALCNGYDYRMAAQSEVGEKLLTQFT